MKPKVVLFFDTSKVTAGCLMQEARPLPILLELVRIYYGTDMGDEALRALFSRAQALRGEGYHVEVGAEQPQGTDPRFQSGRAMANAHIGVLQDYTRRYGVTWGGVYAPATCKLALTGNGAAGKERMIQFANARYGDDIERVYGRRLVFTGDSRTCCEHEADAIGGALAMAAGKPYIIRATGGRTHKAFARRVIEKTAGPQGRLEL